MMNKSYSLYCAHMLLLHLLLPNLPVYSDIIRPLASGITLLERIKQEEISSKTEGRQSHAAHLRALQQEQLQINHEYVQALSAVINAESLNNWVQRTTVMYPASFGGDQTTVRYSRPWGQQTTGVMHAPGFGGSSYNHGGKTTDVMHIQSFCKQTESHTNTICKHNAARKSTRKRKHKTNRTSPSRKRKNKTVTHILRVKNNNKGL